MGELKMQKRNAWVNTEIVTAWSSYWRNRGRSTGLWEPRSLEKEHLRAGTQTSEAEMMPTQCWSLWMGLLRLVLGVRGMKWETGMTASVTTCPWQGTAKGWYPEEQADKRKASLLPLSSLQSPYSWSIQLAKEKCSSQIPSPSIKAESRSMG